jgi:hypothetical protein
LTLKIGRRGTSAEVQAGRLARRAAQEQLDAADANIGQDRQSEAIQEKLP